MKLVKIYNKYIDIESIKNWYIKTFTNQILYGYQVYADNITISKIYDKKAEAKEELERIIRLITN